MEKQKNREGFTLIEMVCVIAIMGILIAVAVPSYQRIRDGSARQVALANARTNYSMGKAQQEITAMIRIRTAPYGQGRSMGENMRRFIRAIPEKGKFWPEIKGEAG